MKRSPAADLADLLHRLDGRGYPAYKDLQGCWELDTATLFIDHVQGDPFASPSRVRLRVPMARAGFARESWQPDGRRIGLVNLLARRLAFEAEGLQSHRGSGRSGTIALRRPGQEVLERTSVVCTAGWVEARLTVGLPAAGRRILGGEAAELLLAELPELGRRALLYSSYDPAVIRQAGDVNEDAQALRGQLPELGLVAFLAEGAILPRRSGVDDRPLPRELAVPLQVPPSLRVEVTLPHAGRIAGLGIPPGITLIVGGGFHGKSCLLQALERGVYDHRPGDGRELVVTEPSAVKVRAEDGRSVQGVDISAFIRDLPGGRETAFFCTDNASGSPSMAAGIVEALEAGCRLLLIDEDTAATNFLIRDRRMQELVLREQEPITPFLDRARQLYTEHGVSTILVLGGSGDYFEVADLVVQLDAYVPRDVTARAHQIAAAHATGRRPEAQGPCGPVTARIPRAASLDPSRGRREVSIKTRDRVTVQFGEQEIDLTALAQLVDPAQTRALAEALLLLRDLQRERERSLPELFDLVEAELRRQGLDGLSRTPTGDFASFRRQELAAALARLRSLEIVRPGAAASAR